MLLLESRGTTSLFQHLRKKDDYTNENTERKSFSGAIGLFIKNPIFFHNCLDHFYPLWAPPAGALKCRQAKALSPLLRQPLHSLLLKLYALALCASATTAPLKLAPSY